MLDQHSPIGTESKVARSKFINKQGEASINEKEEPLARLPFSNAAVAPQHF
jgi:hypothetical protein